MVCIAYAVHSDANIPPDIWILMDGIQFDLDESFTHSKSLILNFINFKEFFNQNELNLFFFVSSLCPPSTTDFQQRPTTTTNLQRPSKTTNYNDQLTMTNIQRSNNIQFAIVEYIKYDIWLVKLPYYHAKFERRNVVKCILSLGHGTQARNGIASSSIRKRARSRSTIPTISWSVGRIATIIKHRNFRLMRPIWRRMDSRIYASIRSIMMTMVCTIAEHLFFDFKKTKLN